MKLLAVCVLGCAVMLLAAAEDADEEAEQKERNNLVKRYTLSHRSWSRINNRYFFFVHTRMTWASAERYCQSIGGNLASVHTLKEYQWLQKLIFVATHDNKETWIGASDAQQEGTWLWSDGTRLRYTNWCRGEPNNHKAQQNCLQMNHHAYKCWDDLQCYVRRPSLCVKKRC